MCTWYEYNPVYAVFMFVTLPYTSSAIRASVGGSISRISLQDINAEIAIDAIGRKYLVFIV